MNLKDMKLPFILNLLFLPLLMIAGPGDQVLADLNAKIDGYQYEIDSKDGLADGKVTLSNTYNSQRATELYITIVDALQKEINDKEQLWMHTRDELKIVKDWLVETNPDRFGEQYYLDKFETNYNIYLNKDELVIRSLKQNPSLAINMYSSYKQKPYSYEILTHLFDKNSELFMLNVHRFDKHPRVHELIDELVSRNPIKMKRWLGTNTSMGDLLQNSSQPTTQLFSALYNNYGKASKSYYLMDEIISGKISASEAHAIGQDVDKFREHLIQLSIQPTAIGQDAVFDRLKDESLRVIRPINDLHETKNPAIRFKSIENLTAKELYIYMAYAQEEIFTTTYNGFYERFMKKLGKQDPYEFLQAMNFSQYRTFIKMAAGYSTLDDVLAKMSEENRKVILTKFTNNLEEGTIEESLQAAVDVADTFGSLDNKKLKDFFTKNMSSELARVESRYDQHGIRVYSLLTGILAQSDAYNDDWINSLVTNYQIPKINELTYNSLLNQEGKIIQQVFFYDDDDGKASYNSFMPGFRNGNWTIEDKSTYVKMTSKDESIEVYANKPQYEFKGKDALRAYFRETGKNPSVVIHRGHSFYVDTTISTLTPNAKLVLLGSCGGYHNLSSVLDRSPDVHIISSKQIGSMGINDPMIRLMNTSLLKKEDIDWTKFWNTLESKFKGNSTNHTRFQDYVPPHQNLGAIFIMAYNRMKERDGY